MNIGFTYDLREDYLLEGHSEEETAEFDSSVTIQAIIAALEELGHSVDPIGNVKSLLKRLTTGQRWDLVFNITEGMSGFTREAQVPTLLEMHNIPYTFSDPLRLCICLHKGITKRLIRDLGVPTSAFHIVEENADIESVSIPLPLFAKPIAEGTGKGITPLSKITSKKELVIQCEYLLKTFRQPVLVEEYLPGREFTVGISGTGAKAKVIAVLEVILNEKAEKEVYSYANKENSEELVQYVIANDAMAEEAGKSALKVWKGLGCRDAGRLDIRSDAKGVPCVMEVNPLAGLHPTHSDLPMMCTLSGIPYKKLIQLIVESAAERI